MVILHCKLIAKTRKNFSIHCINIVISLISWCKILWKRPFTTEFCAYSPKTLWHFHTRKLGEITVFCAVISWSVNFVETSDFRAWETDVQRCSSIIKIGVLKKLCNIYRKTLVLEAFFY